MEKETFCKKIGFEPVVKDNHVLYYEKGDYKLFDKYTMVGGDMKLGLEVTKGDEVIYSGENKTEKEIEDMCK